MNSEFNTVFTNIIEGINGMSLSDVAGAVFPNTPTTPPNTPTNPPKTSATSNTSNQFKNHSGGIIKNLLQAAPGILKTLEAQEKLWSGKANIGLGELAEMIKGYNEKRALNAMYGIIDYAKSKNPILIMQDNDMIKTIKQQLLQKQNEKQ